IEELRELSHGVHPSILSELGLADALRSVVARSVVPVMLLGLPSERVDPEIEEAAYYVVTEAVANAHKHADATMLRVRVATPPDLLDIDVTDDGRGGAVEQAGSGLEGLRARVEALGGEFRVATSSRGTTVSALLPAQPR